MKPGGTQVSECFPLDGSDSLGAGAAAAVSVVSMMFGLIAAYRCI